MLGKVIATFFLLILLSVLLSRAKRSFSLVKTNTGIRYGAPRRIPSKDPIFGIDTALANLQWMKENRRIKAIYAQVQTYGRTFESRPFGKRVITTVDPRNIQFVLATEHEKFGVGPVRGLAQTPMTGCGIITSDGDVWMRGRNMIRPTFTRTQINNAAMFESHFNWFFDLLPMNGETVNLQPLFDRLILDASSEFIFGKSFESLFMDKCPVDSQRFLDAFSYAQKGVGTRVFLGKMSFLIRDQRFWDSCALIREYTQKHVDVALGHRSARLKTADDRYILVHEMAKETTNREELTSQLLSVFFCGERHTGCSFVESWGLEKEDLTFERLKAMRYVQYVVNEALRLYPPVPNQSRGCLAEIALPFGGGIGGQLPICVFPGDTISMNFYTLHRDPSACGPDIEAFRPERWRDVRPGWNYVPFGGGARHCPAQQLALFWVGYTLVRMALEYKEIQNMDTVFEYVENLKLNMESRNGVKVKLVRA